MKKKFKVGDKVVLIKLLENKYGDYPTDLDNNTLKIGMISTIDGHSTSCPQEYTTITDSDTIIKEECFYLLNDKIIDWKGEFFIPMRIDNWQEELQ